MLKIRQMLLAGAICLAMSGALYANKSSVEIKSPESAVKGSEITITINVSHSANNFIHHTSWAYVKVNGKEVGRWEYPFESANFTREVKVRVDGPLDIESKAECNIHGSAGAVTAHVKVK